MGDLQASGARARVGVAAPVALVVGLLASLLPLAAAHAADPAAGLIAFSSDRVGGSEIFVIAPDGSGLRQVTHAGPTGFAFGPAWSPDGTTLAYVRASQGSRQPAIHLIGADGSGDHVLIKDKLFGEFSPSFSPDGSTIVFVRCRPPGGPCTLYTVGVNGRNLTPLLPFSVDGADLDGRYSPDGSQIVFNVQYQHGGLSAIYVMNADGSNQRRVTKWSLEAFAPAWSPDGSTIALTSHCCDGGRNRIFTAAPDGSGLTPITNPGQRHDYGPTYSPLGDRIAFERDAPDFSTGSVWIADADGSNAAKLIGHAFQPAWSGAAA
jgi:TolB protein